MWLPFALVGYSCLAVVTILDKFILSKEKISPLLFVFYSTIFLSPLLLIFPFLQFPDSQGWLIVGLGSLSFVLGLGTMFYSYLNSEVSRMGPFIGGLLPLFVLALSRRFLGESIVPMQLVGIFLLSIGTFIISFQKKRLFSWRSLILAIGSAALFSVYHVSAKYTYSTLGFRSGFIIMWGLMGIVGLLLLLSRTVRKSIFYKKPLTAVLWDHLWRRKDTSRERFLVVAMDKGLGIVGVVLVQYSISLGSVSMVNALSGVQFGLLVLIVALLSKFFPTVFKERYAAGKFRQELLAVLVIGVGLAFLVR